MADEGKLLYEPNAPDYRPPSTLDNNFKQSLFDKLAPDSTLSTFMDVLTQVDDVLQLLNNTGSSSEHFTVFCPTNNAFRQDLDIYTRSHLDEFLRNHIVPNNKLDPETLKHSSHLKTLVPGQTIQVTHHFFTHKTLLNDKALVDTEHSVEAVNGIAYKIDHLLRPVIH